MRKFVICMLPFFLLPQGFAQLPEFYKRVDRIIWVVDDVEKITQGWKKLGFEQIQNPVEVTLGRTQFRGKPVSAKVKVAAGRLGALQVRWIQPLQGRNAYSEFLAGHGNGVFGLVHRVPTREALETEIRRLAAIGVRILERGDVLSALGTVSYAYMDTGKEGKYTLGLIYISDAKSTEMPAQAPMNLKLSQYAFVVKDPRLVSAYWKKLGFPEMSYTHGPMRDLIHRGVSGRFDQELGWQRHGEIVYEWILPLRGPTVYEEYLKLAGEGFHHIAFDTDDIDAVTARWKDLGFPPIQSGAWGTEGKPGSGRFSYSDTSSIGGVTVEFLWNYR